MGDIFDTATRRRVMQAICKENTRPEERVRSFLHRLGLRFRNHVRRLPGTPDIVLPRHHTVVEVHGCFWHQHRCPLGKLPKSNLEYWLPKLERNRQRDVATRRRLRRLGWHVVVVWECETVSDADIGEALTKRWPGAPGNLRFAAHSLK